jgi:hypothetical protein
MEVASVPKYKIDKSAITWRDLAMYDYCSEYYREHHDHGYIPVKQTCSDNYLLYEAVCKYIINYYIANKKLPTDLDILKTMHTFNMQVQRHGYSGMVAGSVINDMYMSLCEFKQLLHTTLPKINMFYNIRNYSHANIQVSHVAMWSTNTHIYVMCDSKDPVSYLEMVFVSLLYDKRLYVIQYNSSHELTIKEVFYEANVKQHAKRRIESLMSGIANNVYVPRFNCQERSCPHYNTCDRFTSNTRVI